MRDSRKKEIRMKADTFHEACRIGRYGIIDLFKECDRSGYKLIRYPLGEEADIGFSMKKEDDIIIFVNTSSRLSRVIFTLAHEIGHVILHMDKAGSFVDDDITISGRSTDREEQEANYFAACLLMPSDAVDKFFDLEIECFEKQGLTALDIARMMSEFNVSFDMVLNRLENLGKITKDEKIRLDNEKSQARVGNLLQSVGGNSRLNYPDHEIGIPHEYIEYAIYNYNHDAIPAETLERVLKYYRLTVEDVADRLEEHEEEETVNLDMLIGELED